VVYLHTENRTMYGSDRPTTVRHITVHTHFDWVSIAVRQSWP